MVQVDCTMISIWLSNIQQLNTPLRLHPSGSIVGDFILYNFNIGLVVMLRFNCELFENEIFE